MQLRETFNGYDFDVCGETLCVEAVMADIYKSAISHYKVDTRERRIEVRIYGDSPQNWQAACKALAAIFEWGEVPAELPQTLAEARARLWQAWADGEEARREMRG